jgi:hypothetical protein
MSALHSSPFHQPAHGAREREASAKAMRELSQHGKPINWLQPSVGHDGGVISSQTILGTKCQIQSPSQPETNFVSLSTLQLGCRPSLLFICSEFLIDDAAPGVHDGDERVKRLLLLLTTLQIIPKIIFIIINRYKYLNHLTMITYTSASRRCAAVFASPSPDPDKASSS